MIVSSITWLLIIVGFAFVTMTYIILHFCFLVVTVEGFSMAPYLMDGDRVLAVRYCPLKMIKRGTIVVFEAWSELTHNDHSFLIKRVIGLPRDVLVTGRTKLGHLESILDDRYFHYFLTRFSVDTSVPFITNSTQAWQDEAVIWEGGTQETIVPERSLFVKGDWLMGSLDSITNGPVPFEKIKGVLIIKLISQKEKATVV